MKVGPVGIEPTTHRLKVRPSKTTLCQSNLLEQIYEVWKETIINNINKF